MFCHRAPYDTSSDGGSSSYESDWEAEVNARSIKTFRMLLLKISPIMT